MDAIGLCGAAAAAGTGRSNPLTIPQPESPITNPATKAIRSLQDVLCRISEA
jgi:hypothetical protein